MPRALQSLFARLFVALVAAEGTIARQLPTANVTLTQAPQSTEAQATKFWADVKAPSAWEDVVVDVIVPGSGSRPSRVEQIRAKTITFRSSIPPKLFSIVAVPSPNGSETYFIGGGRFLIADGPGITAVLLYSSTLKVKRSYFGVPMATSGVAGAIARFASEISERRVADEFEKYSPVQLGVDAPQGFFVRGSFSWPRVSRHLLSKTASFGSIYEATMGRPGPLGWIWQR